jgi:hypothetical protein
MSLPQNVRFSQVRQQRQQQQQSDADPDPQHHSRVAVAAAAAGLACGHKFLLPGQRGDGDGVEAMYVCLCTLLCGQVVRSTSGELAVTSVGGKRSIIAAVVALDDEAADDVLMHCSVFTHIDRELRVRREQKTHINGTRALALQQTKTKTQSVRLCFVGAD